MLPYNRLHCRLVVLELDEAIATLLVQLHLGNRAVGCEARKQEAMLDWWTIRGWHQHLKLLPRCRSFPFLLVQRCQPLAPTLLQIACVRTREVRSEAGLGGLWRDVANVNVGIRGVSPAENRSKADRRYSDGRFCY